MAPSIDAQNPDSLPVPAGFDAVLDMAFGIAVPDVFGAIAGVAVASTFGNAAALAGSTLAGSTLAGSAFAGSTFAGSGLAAAVGGASFAAAAGGGVAGAGSGFEQPTAIHPSTTIEANVFIIMVPRRASGPKRDAKSSVAQRARIAHEGRSAEQGVAESSNGRRTGSRVPRGIAAKVALRQRESAGIALAEVHDVMIIVYGTRSHTSDTPLAIPCNNCRQPALMQSDWHQYFHLMFVPTFPTGKHRTIHCRACDNSYETKASTPIWTFIGSMIIVACVLGGAARQALHHFHAGDSAASISAAATAPTPAVSSAPAAASAPAAKAAAVKPAAPAASHAAAPSASARSAAPAPSASAAPKKKK